MVLMEVKVVKESNLERKPKIMMSLRRWSRRKNNKLRKNYNKWIISLLMIYLMIQTIQIKFLLNKKYKCINNSSGNSYIPLQASLLHQVLLILIEKYLISFMKMVWSIMVDWLLNLISRLRRTKSLHVEKYANSVKGIKILLLEKV